MKKIIENLKIYHYLIVFNKKVPRLANNSKTKF